MGAIFKPKYTAADGTVRESATKAGDRSRPQ
jgi:hypothetical protein